MISIKIYQFPANIRNKSNYIVLIYIFISNLFLNRNNFNIYVWKKKKEILENKKSNIQLNENKLISHQKNYISDVYKTPWKEKK